MMTVVLVFNENAIRLICGYALQSGRSLEEQHFYVLKGEWDMHGVWITMYIYRNLPDD